MRPEVRPEVPLSPAQWLSQRTTAGGASNCGLWLLRCGEITHSAHPMCCRAAEKTPDAGDASRQLSIGCRQPARQLPPADRQLHNQAVS